MAWAAAWPACLAFLLVVLLIKNLADYLQAFNMVSVEQAAIRDLRNDIQRHLQTLSLGFHHERRSGALVSRVTNDVEYLRNALASEIPYGEVALPAAIAAIQQGVPLTIVHAGVVSVADLVWVTRKDDTAIAKFADLKGRTLGYSSPKSVTDILSSIMMNEHGLGGLELAVVGLGPNGHVAFNEPGSPPDSRTRVIELTQESREQSSEYWEGEEAIPQRAMTMGLGTILSARKIVLIVSGESKAEIVRRALEEEPTLDVPASWLKQAGKRLHVILDREAASALTRD